MSEPQKPTRDAHYSAIQHVDAEDMWCPEVRRLYCDEDGSGAGINRRTDFPPSRIANCIGSKCMAWRWVAAAEEDETGAFSYSSTSLGYCGKAGGA